MTEQEELEYIALLEEEIRAKKRLRVYPMALKKLGDVEYVHLKSFLEGAQRYEILRLADACAKLIMLGVQ